MKNFARSASDTMASPRIRSFMAAAVMSCLLFTVGACRTDKPDATPDTAGAPGPGRGLSGYPGQSPDSTRSYLASLDFSVVDSVFEGRVPCDDTEDCVTPDTVLIRIVPASKAHEVPMRAALDSATGHIVAMIINMEDKAFGPYGLAAHDTAYLWVGPMQSGGNKIAMFAIDRGTGAATLRATAREAGWCAGSNVRRSIPAVHMNEQPMCADSSLYSEPRQTASLVQLASTSTGFTSTASALAFAGIRGLWFSCSLGCCEARRFESAS